MEIKRDERTKFNLENCLRMSFHPNGVRRFADGVINELDIGGSYTAALLKGSATGLDIVKCVLYLTTLGTITYSLLK